MQKRSKEIDFETWVEQVDQLIVLTVGQSFSWKELIPAVRLVIQNFYKEGVDPVIAVQRLFNSLINAFREGGSSQAPTYESKN